MSNHTAVFENHDRLFLSRIVGVPRELNGAASEQRWVDNYAYRYDAGLLCGWIITLTGWIITVSPLASPLHPSLLPLFSTCFAGRVSFNEFRFGGEGHGLAGVYNFAPFACQLVHSNYSHLDLVS
jgi:hypothetical protein